VVIRFSRSRKRYERQGLLVEEHALKKAEAECLAEAEVRTRRKARDAERRAGEDEDLARSMADEIRRLFPRCLPEEAETIARHAMLRRSGRVGKKAAAKEMEERPLVLAVVAAIRHGHTRYDELLMSGMERSEARAAVRGEVDRILADRRRRRLNPAGSHRAVAAESGIPRLHVAPQHPSELAAISSPATGQTVLRAARPKHGRQH
jgi:hypothetical protein